VDDDDNREADSEKTAEPSSLLPEGRGLLPPREDGVLEDPDRVARAVAEAFGTDDAVEIIEMCRNRGTPP
jgi:hypothetical protein